VFRPHTGIRRGTNFSRFGHAGVGLHTADERVEALGAGAVDDDRVVGRAGDVHRQRDLVALGEAGLELGRVGTGRQADIHHGAHRASERGRIDLGGIALDHLGGLQPAHPIGHRGGGEVHAIGELLPADPTFRAQDADDSSVDLVEYQGISGHAMSLPPNLLLINGSREHMIQPC
jgi:hypothetical protein